MQLSTTNEITGKKVAKVLGVVKGNTVRARWFGRDIAAGLKSIVGGEIGSYTKLLTDAREHPVPPFRSVRSPCERSARVTQTHWKRRRRPMALHTLEACR